MRPGVDELIRLGPMPTDGESEDHPVRAGRWEHLVGELFSARDVTDAEAAELVKLFPRDGTDSFGIAWTLVHVVESAPSWPLDEAITGASGPWPELLKQRASARSGGRQ